MKTRMVAAAVAVLAAAVGMSGCDSGGGSDKATLVGNDLGPAYHSVTSLVDAVNTATNGSLNCGAIFEVPRRKAYIGSAAQGACIRSDGTYGASVDLYTTASAAAQDVDYLLSGNPGDEVFLGYNWILLARDAHKLVGHMPGKLFTHPSGGVDVE